MPPVILLISRLNTIVVNHPIIHPRHIPHPAPRAAKARDRGVRVQPAGGPDRFLQHRHASSSFSRWRRVQPEIRRVLGVEPLHNILRDESTQKPALYQKRLTPPARPHAGGQAPPRRAGSRTVRSRWPWLRGSSCDPRPTHWAPRTACTSRESRG